MTAAADDTLDDAEEKRDAARTKRADAERLERLADAEKQSRRAERAAKP